MSEDIKNIEETEVSETPAPVKEAVEKTSSEDSYPDRSRRFDPDSKPQRVPRFKKKVCRFCHSKDVAIDYKRSDILEKFITDRGKILPRRITGTCAKHQRLVATEIKKARMIALLPFVEL
ncbi:MAG: 30S ribosomal protein S18 [Spirochaetes bacterium]|nr:30S ribosomal protein S18 [Spirochaetota bacterium]